MPLSPKRAMANGWRGGRSGPSSWRKRASELADERAEEPAVGALVRAEAASGDVDGALRVRGPAAPLTGRSSITAVPSSSGCASGASGCASSSPCRSSGSSRRKGEASASECTVEQMSCT